MKLENAPEHYDESHQMVKSASVNRQDMTIMVIDDSQMIRVAAEKLLLGAGYKVVLAEDSFDAISQIVEHKPDVIIIDIVMPAMDGYMTCELIKNNKKYKDIPIIMLSGKDGRSDRAKGKLAGANLYLTKPFTSDGIIKAIENVISV